MKHSFLIRCDADRQTGLGHVKRCLKLATELIRSEQIEVFFCTSSKSLGASIIEESGFNVLHLESPNNELSYTLSLEKIIKRKNISSLIIDVRDSLERKTIDYLKHEHNLNVFILDDGSERRLAADVNFYPPAPGVKNLNWEGFKGELCAGWEWVVLGISPEELSIEQNKADKSGNNSIFVSMGGSDKHGLTPKILTALSSVQAIEKAYVVCGPAMTPDNIFKIKQQATNLDYQVKIFENPENIPTIINRCGFGIITFGVTAYELASFGVPSMNIAISQDHFDHSLVFEDSSISRSLGLMDELNFDGLAKKIDAFIKNKELRKTMQQAALELTSISSIQNVSKKIINRIASD